MARFLDVIAEDGQTLDSLMSTHENPSAIAKQYDCSYTAVYRQLNYAGWACRGWGNWYKVPRDVVVAVVRATGSKSDTALYLGTHERYVSECMEAEVMSSA